jgi:hypothetical protein
MQMNARQRRMMARMARARLLINPSVTEVSARCGFTRDYFYKLSKELEIWEADHTAAEHEIEKIEDCRNPDYLPELVKETDKIQPIQSKHDPMLD